MPLLTLALAAALAAAPAARTDPARALVGRAAWAGDVDGEWNGWTLTRQAVLGDAHATQAFRRGSRRLVTLNHRFPEAGPRGAYTVVAAIVFDVPKGYEASEQGLCEWQGQATPLVFAVVAAAKKGAEYHPRVRAAWRLDLDADRIVPLAPATVRCGNAAFEP